VRGGAVVAAIGCGGLQTADKRLPVLDDEAQRCEVRPARQLQVLPHLWRQLKLLLQQSNADVRQPVRVGGL